MSSRASINTQIFLKRLIFARLFILAHVVFYAVLFFGKINWDRMGENGSLFFFASGLTVAIFLVDVGATLGNTAIPIWDSSAFKFWEKIIIFPLTSFVLWGKGYTWKMAKWACQENIRLEERCQKLEDEVIRSVEDISIRDEILDLLDGRDLYHAERIYQEYIDDKYRKISLAKTLREMVSRLPAGKEIVIKSIEAGDLQSAEEKLIQIRSFLTEAVSLNELNQVVEFINTGDLEVVDEFLKKARECNKKLLCIEAYEQRIKMLPINYRYDLEEKLERLKECDFNTRPFRKAIHDLDKALGEAERLYKERRGR